jgi:hypothetical protein
VRRHLSLSPNFLQGLIESLQAERAELGRCLHPQVGMNLVWKLLPCFGRLLRVRRQKHAKGSQKQKQQEPFVKPLSIHVSSPCNSGALASLPAARLESELPLAFA